MSNKRQIKKFEKNLDILRSITRAFEHTATKKMEVNKREIANLDKYLVDVKQTYVSAKISVVKKPGQREAALKTHVRVPTKAKVVVLVSSEPRYYGHLLGFMVDDFIKELASGNCDAVIIGLPGKEEFDKKNRQGFRYTYFEFHDEHPNWQVISDVSRLLFNYSQINVIFARFQSILNQDIQKHDLAQEITNVTAGEYKKYLIKPEPKTALSYLEQQIITSQLLQKMYENGLAKSAIRVKILEIGEIAQKLSEAIEKFEIYKRKVLRDISNRKLINLYSSSDVWRSESIFTIYR